MNDADIVADASAVIALLVGEPFIRFDALRLPNASDHAVNLSEVLAQLQEIRMPEAESGTVLARLNLRVIGRHAESQNTIALRRAPEAHRCDHTQVQSRENGATFGLGHPDLLQLRQHLR